MRNKALPLAILSAVATLPVLYPKREPASVHPMEIVAAISFWPLLITSVILIIDSVNQKAFRSPTNVHLVIFVFACVFPATLFGGMIVRKIGKERYLAEQARREHWLRYDDILLPHILDYIEEFPDKIGFPHDDDRAEIEGLVSYLRPFAPEIPFADNSIIDPWGNPVTVVLDHDNDMQLRFDDAFYGVASQTGNAVVAALYCEQKYSLSVSSNQQWQLEGGWIKNP